MKRLFTVLLVIVYVTTVLLSAILPVVKAEGAQHEEQIVGENVGESSENGGEQEAMQPVWLSYIDYLRQESAKDFADPARNVGYEAVFNLSAWQSFICTADPAAGGASWQYITHEDLKDTDGNSIRVKIIDHAVDASGNIWYQVETVGRSTLPIAVEEKSYIYHLDSYSGDKPSLIMLPQKAMFLRETVEIKKAAEVATRSVVLPTAELPVFFDVLPVGVDQEYFDLGDTTGWHAKLAENGYHYVSVEDVYLIAPEVTVAYERLQQATSAKEYEEIWVELPESVREQFTEQHMAVLNERQEELNNVTYSQTVMYNGKELAVSVSGPIPEQGVTLHVGAVADEDILNGGFDVTDAADIITALDIKLLREDSSEWQPEDGKYVELDIGVGALGCPDGQVVRLHHKHGDRISVNDVFVVMDGKLNIRTYGFSMYVVENVGSTVRGQETANNGRTSITIGETRVYYFRVNNYSGNGTWIVNDPMGAIHYTVHSNDASSADIGNGGVEARWIKIVALKETPADKPVTLQYTRGDNIETFYLAVDAPKAAAGQKRLYIKDEVNTTGCIVATAVDDQGNEVSLEGAAFNWSRRDDVNGNMFIVPAAYQSNYRAVNIARDHGGLVEARKANNAYVPTEYTVDVILADGTELSATYKVYYQSEIINAGFEFPDSKYRDYSFFPNGYPELYWKTTAPGIRKNNSNANITKDIEYGDVTNQTNANQGGTSYGVWKAADWETGGSQFAELNAEEVGALYQDIITAPDEDIVWEFAHAKRPNQDWASNVQNKMYLVIGATETAQALTNAQLNTLVREARQKASGNQAFMNCQEPYKLTFSLDGEEYWVWYHDADNQTDYSANGNYGWANLEGTYTVPEGQYRTRVFFVSDPDSNASNTNAGNVIDKSIAGQYKSYLIEYFEQTVDEATQQSKLVHRETVKNKDGVQVEADESGEALIYSSALIKNLDNFIGNEHDYLYMIQINGQNYPYDIRYSGQPALYIENYKGTKEYPIEGVTPPNDYDQYDIVMHVYVRDTVVAVQKVLEFPAAMTTVQKLNLINSLGDGYHADFSLRLKGQQKSEDDPETDIKITMPDPKNNYTGFAAMGEDPEINKTYVVEETATTDLVGLKLDHVTFETTLYSYGKGNKLDPSGYDSEEIAGDAELISTEFIFTKDQKIADIKVTNTYVEKETTIYYKAVGKGKVELTTGGGYQDIPSETLAFYSGQAVGAVQQAGKGATFVGWFTDPECKNPITAADGVYDETTKTFKPNANIINADSVTFYAKFDTGAIVINRENAFPGQIFVYRVQQTDENGNPIANGAEFYVTVAPDENGKYSETIVDVPAGYYTVTEIGNWSWRHPPEQQRQLHPGTGEKVYTFTEGANQPDWLSGLSDILKNVFTGTGGAS